MKKYSTKFWVIFWVSAVIFLAIFYFFLQIRNNGIGKAVDYLPLDQKNKTVVALADYVFKQDGIEKTFLILFQNNMELRPGGGYIGSFGIVKTLDGKVTMLQTHDVSNFDGRIPDAVAPPYPMKETLRIPSLKLRDSNFSPDFPTNARLAEEFYKMGGGQEKFDGIFGITADVLPSFLQVTGPIKIEGFPGEYADKSAIINLEHQVEIAYREQGIAKGERKSIMNQLAKEIASKVLTLDNTEKIEFARIIEGDLDSKDIQLFFKDENLQKMIEKANWGGLVDTNWKKDYVMAVDANLNAWKSDYHIKRSLDYSVDLTKDKPEAILKITYNHTAKEKDWMTKDYQTYLRVYVPENAWLIEQKNLGDPNFGKEFGKKYFGFLIHVPLGESKTVELRYELPQNAKEDYKLKIQKQAGVSELPIKARIINADGQVQEREMQISSDFEM